MAIEVEVKGVKELLSDLNGFPKAMEKSVILQMSQIAKESLYKGAARHKVSGELYESVYNRKITGGRAVGHDTGRAPYAKFVLFGTKRHWIGPKDKKALRWAPSGFVGPLGDLGGGWAFSKGHWHPGYRGDDYMETAKDDALALFGQFVSKAIKDNL